MHRTLIRFTHEEPVTVIVREPKDHIQKKWLAGNYYECQRNGLLNYIAATHEKGLTYVDAGASIGNHSFFFARVMEAKQVFAFEPVRESLEHFMINLELNPGLVPQIALFPCALGEANEMAGMVNVNPANVGMWRIVDDYPVHQIKDSDTSREKVEVLRLDDCIVPEDKIDILKIDVEHYQVPMLRGSLQTIRDNQPTIYIECETDPSFVEVKKELSSVGYRYTGVCLNHTPTFKFEPA